LLGSHLDLIGTWYTGDEENVSRKLVWGMPSAFGWEDHMAVLHASSSACSPCTGSLRTAVLLKVRYSCVTQNASHMGRNHLRSHEPQETCSSPILGHGLVL
jgi:hypothetical protein